MAKWIEEYTAANQEKKAKFCVDEAKKMKAF